MAKHYPEIYGNEEFVIGMTGYKLNFSLTPNNVNIVKNYFTLVNKIDDDKKLLHFNSPLNCLWENDELKA
jgi:hypothetical protein